MSGADHGGPGRPAGGPGEPARRVRSAAGTGPRGGSAGAAGRRSRRRFEPRPPPVEAAHGPGSRRTIAPTRERAREGDEVVDSVPARGRREVSADAARRSKPAPGAASGAQPRGKARPSFSPEEGLRDLRSLRPPPSWPAKGGARPAPSTWPRLVEQALQHPLADKGAARRSLADDIYGPYRLLERIAVGGMAEVFRAKRSGVEGFEKVVAVKRILSHLSDNKEFVDMFIDEAKMVAGLTHPNIVQIFDLGKIEKSYYIAMEYVHGRDLRTILRRAKERGLRGAARPLRARGQQGLRRPRVRAPQEGRARAGPC